MKKDDKQEFLLHELEESSNLSRRDAMKLMAMSPLAASAIMAASGTVTEAQASDAKGKIVIVGGGLAGVATAARLTSSLSNPNITIIEPNPRSVSYQPGLTLIGSGIWKRDEIIYNLEDFLPQGTKLVKEKATQFDPDNNLVKTESGQTITYDYLVVAAGLILDYQRIKGLKGQITSMQKDPDDVKEVIGKDGIHSIYFDDGAAQTWKGIQELIEKAKNHTGETKLQAFFTHPEGPVKCGGAPKKIMYLTDDRLREAGVRDKVELTFMPNGGKMFGLPEYHDAIVKQFEARDMKWKYQHNLSAIDPESKTATFKKPIKVKVKNDFYDPSIPKDHADYEPEYVEETSYEEVSFAFDFIHITPPMKAPDEIAKSPLKSGVGGVPVDFETLQHAKYDNVFALGDIAAVPFGKTGGSARKQYKVVAQNLIAKMEGRIKKNEKGKDILPAKFDGYTVCPLITKRGMVMLAEFNYKDPANGVFTIAKPAPSFPLNPAKERWAWWFMKVYMLKPMTVYGMLAGRV